MAEKMSLDNILSDKDAPPIETTKEAPVVIPEIPSLVPEGGTKPVSSTRRAHREKEQAARGEAEGKVRDPETGQFVEKPKDPAAAVALPKESEAKTAEAAPAVEPAKPVALPQMTEKERAYLAAAQDERRKRQDLEKQLQALQTKPGEPEKTFFDDPDAALKRVEQTVYNVALQTRLSTADAIGRSRHPDYDQKIQVFTELSKQVPGLRDEMLNAADPGEFAYQAATNHLKFREAGSVEAMTAKIEKELRLKIEGEFKKKQEDEAKERAAIPGSLSTVTGNNPSKPVWSGPTSLDNILKS